MNIEIYPKAPILEAGIDIRIRAAKHLELEKLKAARDDAYPELFGKPVKIEVKIEQGGGDNVPPSGAQSLSVPLGFSYRSADTKQAFQVRLDGFTHNRMAPYDRWESFIAEAKRLWPLYKKIAHPEVIEMIGLNYVNEIFVPLGSSFEDYFRVYLEIPKDLPQVVNAYSIGFQLSIPDGQGFIHISQAYGPPKKEGFLTINLNIQAFRPLNLPPDRLQDEQLWSFFETLRIAKDQAFEACITDRVREVIR
jgi:uncharacterized protein (TIGR04255 family)